MTVVPLSISFLQESRTFLSKSVAGQITFWFRLAEIEMQYEYMVKTKGMSSLSNLEHLGEALEHGLNTESNIYQAAGWDLFQIQVISDIHGNNGLIYVYRRARQ